jgi:hypothetical protein
MCYHGRIMECPIAELMDDSSCSLWLESHLHPQGLTCPHGGHAARRLCRAPGDFPASRCRACDGYSTLLTGTVFAPTRQRPATLGLLLRGGAKGTPTARLAPEWGLSRTQLPTLRQRLPTNLHEPVPTGVMTGPTFEADARDQNAGEQTHPPSGPRGSAPAAGQHAARARHLRP